MIEKTCVVYRAPSGCVIWNLLPVPQLCQMIIEERNDNARNVSIACIEFSGKVVWRVNHLPETWWINVNRVTLNQVVLRVFQTTTNPDVVSEIVLNVRNGEPVSVQPEPECTNGLLRPFVYVQGEAEFNTVQKFLEERVKQQIFIGAEYLEANDLVFIAYYIGQPGNFTNVLACFSRTGELSWSEEIGTNLEGMGIGTFFIATNTLFFVKNKTELVTFRIV